MENLAWLISGGFAKGYRTQVLLGNLPIALGGLGLAALGAKVDDAKRAGEPSLQRQNNASSLARSCRIQALCLKVPPNMHYGAERCGR